VARNRSSGDTRESAHAIIVVCGAWPFAARPARIEASGAGTGGGDSPEAYTTFAASNVSSTVVGVERARGGSVVVGDLDLP
jgi:hypothetical protein